MPISPDFQSTFIRIPERPAWRPGTSASALHAQEEAYFLAYLTDLYTRYGAARLNHFEHNLDVWRQLWRVVEKSDILVLVADARHPLLHFNHGVYEYARAAGKPMVLLLNKVDTLPVATLRRWQDYFARAYPGLHTVVFSSYPSALHRALLDDALDDALAQQISALHLDLAPADLAAHAREVGRRKRAPRVDALGVEGLLRACREIVEEEAGGAGDAVVDFEATRLLTDRDQELLAAKEAERERELATVKERLGRLAEYRSRAGAGEAEEESGYVMDEEEEEGADEECQADARALALMREDGPGAGRGRGGASVLRAVGDVEKTSWREGRKARESMLAMQGSDGDDDEGDMSLKRRKGKGKGRGHGHKRKEEVEEEEEEEEAPSCRRITIGTIGHPNAGKSSLINALTGKKVVSVSRQPGHTKTFQTMLINEHTVLCDCPGLIFPAVDVPRPLQVLSGIFPIPQTRQPMAAVRFLAKCVQLDRVLGVSVPRPVTAVGLCEAYAAKRGFMLAHGRCDSNRAAQTILYACVDGKVQFYFEAPEAGEVKERR
jgi:ribosome biogenesis GTPase A